MDDLEVLHGAAADQVSREIKYLAAKLASVQEARSQGITKAEKIDGSFNPPGILTKPLQGKERVFKRGRFLGLKVIRPVGLGSGAVSAAGADEAEGKGDRPRRALSGPPPGTWDRALGKLPGRGRG